jgi:tetratricopeptide (TPR) repeat protein
MIAAWLAAVWLFAGCATSNAVSVESLRAKAAAETGAAREVAVPGFIGEPRRADPALANASLDQAAAAIAPLRDAPDSPPPAPPSAVVLRARTQASRGDMEGAVRTLAEHVRQSGNDLQAWRELARLLDASGRRDLASDAWLRVLLSLPTDAEALGAGGIDAAAARQPLVAAERLLRLRQMERLGEAPQPDPGAAIARTVALGLSLREIGYLRAAATCLREAASESAKAIGPEAAAIQRQAGDLQRIAGECLMQAGLADEAAACFREALAATGPEDRVALPRLVWCLASQSRANGAALALAESLQRADAPGRSGVSQAAAVLASADQRELAEQVLASCCDASAERGRLAIGQVDRSPCGDTPVQRLLQHGARPSLAAAMTSVAERQGLSAAIDLAWIWTAAHPWQAADMAHALRCLPSPASLVRAALAPRIVDAPVPASMPLAMVPGVPPSFDARAAARLLAAQFELQGGEVERAFELSGGAPADVEPLRAVAVSAATFMEDGARVRALAAQPVVAAPLAAALAEGFAALGDAALADTWAERAIALDDRSAMVWVARSRADLVAAGIDARDQASRTALAAARLSAERAWEAQPSRYEGARRMLELAPADRVEQGELRQLLRQPPVSDVSLRELDRAEANPCWKPCARW